MIIPNGTPGYSQGTPYRKMGWNASDTRPLTSRTAAFREENLLGERGAGFRQFLHILDIGRIGVAAMGVGFAQGALDEALAYAKQRKAFGRAISKFQAIQIKLADMSCEIEAARLLVTRRPLRRTPNETSRSQPRRRSSRPDAWRCAAPRRPCRSTAATGSSRSTPCAASTATPRSYDRRGHRRDPADGDRPRPRRLAAPSAPTARANRRAPSVSSRPRRA